MHHRLITVAALVVAAGTAFALTGCSDVADVLHHQTQGSYDSRAALEQAWSTPASEPDWIPADATRLRMIAATGGAGADATPAVVRVRTATALPASCTEIDRRSMDPFSLDWAPAKIPARVQRCGNWAVVPVSDGWYGWTPLTPDELGQHGR